jgi:predicted permease
LARAGVFSAGMNEGLTRFVFYVAIPAMLFRTLATTALPENVPWRYLAAFYGATFAMFGLGATLAKFGFGWSRRERGIAAISASYSNMVMLGFPLIASAYGDAGTLPLFILIAMQSLLLFPATTWMIELYGNDRKANGADTLRMIGRLILNPIILSLILGILANFLEIEINATLTRLLDTVGAAAPACALIALGVGLAQYKVGGDVRQSLCLVVVKGIVHPACVWIACRLFAVPALWTQIAVLLAAMPTGINAFIFARNYSIRVEVVSKTIVLSTLTAIGTISFLLSAFHV